MKTKKLLSLLVLAASVSGLIACGGNDKESSSSSNDVSPSSSTSSFVAPVELGMKDKTVEYDGETHSIYVEGLPEGAKVLYSGNDKTEPGTYNVSAMVKFSDGTSEIFTAKLIIEKKTSILTADAVQTVYAYGGAKPTFSLNNTEQKVEVKTYYSPGTYQVELFAKETRFYKESNHVVVDFTLMPGNSLGVKFESASFITDGSEKKIEATNIPEGYRVEYTNNTATKQGKYNASCEVYNPAGDLELTLNAILTLDNAKNEDFEQYLNETFVDYLGDDYISWNILTVNPESFGFVRDENNEAKWYTYTSQLDFDNQAAYEEMTEYYSYLKEFENADLSYNQKISYKVLDDYFKSSLASYNPANNFNFFLENVYIDSFGGYASNVGTYLEIYKLHDEYDVIDLLNYVKSLPEAFASYLVYAQDKITAGYPISDRTIDGMVGYLDDVIRQENRNYYLINNIKNNIGSCEFLTAEQIEHYQALTDQYFTECFFPAHKALAEGLVEYKGHCDQEGYLAAYGDLGVKYYTYLMSDLLGKQDLDITEFGQTLKNKLKGYSQKLNSAVQGMYSSDSKNPEDGIETKFMELINGKSLVGEMDPYEMIDFLKEFALTIAPALDSEPTINVKYMDTAAAKVSTALAYYMKSPVDSTESEEITLNGELLSVNTTDTLLTMGHEGYPGHLYSYCFSKQLDISNIAKVMTSTAHAEGWAKYIELKLWEYLKDHHTLGEEYDVAVSYYCDYMYYNELAAYTLYTYIDYGIHVEKWNVNDVAAFLDRQGFNSDAAEDMYYQLIEMPTQYAAYGYGIILFHDVHEQAKKTLGDCYNEIEFNRALLSNGWCSSTELQRIADEYIAETKFVNGI